MAKILIPDDGCFVDSSISEYQVCCFLGCYEPPQWEIRHGRGIDDYTHSCTDHVGHLLTDADIHTIYPIRKEPPCEEEKVNEILGGRS